MKRVVYVGIITAIVLTVGCRKAFNPTVDTTDQNILVVEGMINTGTDSTIIKLSRTVPVGSKITTAPETKAVITIENAQATVLTLTEKTKGVYVAPVTSLDNTKQYRVRIKTSNGKFYVSDLVDSKVTPPIDSVGFLIKDDKLQVYVNTHDVGNKTRYYRYAFRETWMFNAIYESDYITNGKDIVGRLQSERIYTCFSTDTSARTIINSTAALTNDVAFLVPIITIDGSSEKISIKYSILLRQQGLTKDAYDFYENLKKNTESLGSIFDAQPSQLTGNIHNVANPAEPVIGYITAGTTQQKRIFISRALLPKSFVTQYPYGCPLDSAFNGHVPAERLHNNYTIETLLPLQASSNAIPIAYFVEGKVFPDPLLPPGLWGNGKNGYTFTTRECADCTIKGTTKQPAFWK